MEHAEPILNISPDLKKQLEQDEEKLLQGNLYQPWEKMQAAMTSGDASYPQNFVKEQVQNTKDKESSGRLEQHFKTALGGEDILQKLSQLREDRSHKSMATRRKIRSRMRSRRSKEVLSKKVDEEE